MNGRIAAMRGDITQLDVDIIVNAANTSLLGGGGVDGAIHRAAGPALLEACRDVRARQGRCPPGEAVITGAGRLRARHVIHTVGPVWRGGFLGEAALLSRCYTRSLALAAEVGAQSIAFPAISCGVYRFPVHEATAIAIAQVRRWLTRCDTPQRVIFCCFTEEVWDSYAHQLSGLASLAARGEE